MCLINFRTLVLEDFYNCFSSELLCCSSKLGLGLLHWAVQSPGKSKPCSLREGWGSVGGGRLTWHVGEEFVTWRNHPHCYGMRCPRITNLPPGR